VSTLDRYLARALDLGLDCLCNHCLAENGIAAPKAKRPLHDPEDGNGRTCAVQFREGRLVKVKAGMA
jgi:hypothetical protein